MFNVRNGRATTLLAGRSLKYNRTRNIIAISAIILTAMMFTVVFTTGSSILDTLQRSTMRQVGSETHGGFKWLTMQQYETVKADPEIKDISYNIVIGLGENPALNKTPVEIRYTEEKAAEWSFSMPTVGTLPKNKMDIATSTAVLDALGLPHELGVQVPLSFTVDGRAYHDEFTLCGFYEMDVALGISEAYVSREYCDEVAPVWETENPHPEDPGFMAGSISAELFFANSWDLDGKMQALKARCGFGPEVNEGVNWAYAGSEIDITSMLLIFVLLSVIMISGYLIIYNIFYIAVSRDIRFYGLLKTVGTTDRQLKRLVKKQALLLCVIGIPAGLALGFLFSIFVVPVIMSTTSFAEDYVVSANPAVYLGSAAFTLLTVLISCIRPCRLASRVSPVEAVRYIQADGKRKKKGGKTGRVSSFMLALRSIARTPRKAVSILLSISLSLILLNTVFTIVNGFDMEKYLSNQIVSDFRISDATILNNAGLSGDILNGVSEEDIARFREIDGVTDFGCVYMQEQKHVLSGAALQTARDILTEYPDHFGGYAEMFQEALEIDHTIDCHIYGIDEFPASKMKIYDGVLDMEKLKSGNYVVVSPHIDTGEGRYYDIGDKIEIDFGNGRKKEYEVMAIGNIPYAIGPQHGHRLGIDVTMYADEFTAQTGETGALSCIFNTGAEACEKAEAFVSDYCQNRNPNLDYKSRAVYVEEFENTSRSYLLVGGILSLILAMIGILNFINAIITSIETRRRELAVLQSIGMTGRQLCSMLIYEGLIYILLTLLFTLTIGNFLGWGLTMLIAYQIWFFTWHFTLLPVIVCIPPLLLVAALIPFFCYQFMCRSSIVDRLRIAE